jgi:hypothetical protein
MIAPDARDTAWTKSMVRKASRSTRPEALNVSPSNNNRIKFKTFGLESRFETPTMDFVHGYGCSSPSDLSSNASNSILTERNDFIPYLRKNDFPSSIIHHPSSIVHHPSSILPNY